MMRFIKKLWLVVAMGIAQASPHPTCFDKNPKIRSPADIPALSTCTTLPANLIIGASFSGPLTLPGVRLIGNALVVDPDYGMLFGVTEINMPDLVVVIEGFELKGVPALQKLSMPSLKSIGDGAQLHNPSPMWSRIVQTGGPGMNLSFPELEEAGQTFFEGNFEAIDFPKLRKARNMYIKSTADLDCNAVLKQLEKVEFGREDTLECHSSVNIKEENMNFHGVHSSQSPQDASDGERMDFVTAAVGWMSQAILSVGRYIF